MTMKVNVRDGLVVDACAADKLAETFHPDLAALFIDAPDHVGLGWRLIDGEWTEPEQPGQSQLA